MARKASVKTGVELLVSETQELVSRLVAENRLLKAQNKKLATELTRISKGWDQLKALARQAPRRRRSR